MNNTEKNISNQATTENTVTGSISVEKINNSDVSIKELIAKEEVQKAFQRYVAVPDIVTIKRLRNPYENKETKIVTQKIEAMTGTTLEDAVSVELTLLNTELDPVKAVNKKYRIIDYTFALEANMKAGKFLGYAAKGLKLMVTRLEEVKGDEK